ncbi:G2/mitotic-specific cyclin 1/2 [Kwoniella heveanensis CBS 569]|nr:G2/mitotic-specific cyclin 1/2 [Kwoniella heveanensis CBS 569]
MQTRRAARRVDENAPPAAGTIATRSRSTITNGGALAAKATATSTSIPVMKRTASSASATSLKGTTKDAVAGKVDLAAKRRAALGEVTNGGKDVTAGKKGAAVKEERRPLATTQTAQTAVRRTTRTGSAPTAAGAKEEKVTGKRKAVVPSSKIPSRSRSATAASTSTTATAPEAKPLKERKPNVVVDEEPQRKRRKTSSPPPFPEEDEHDLVDEAQYDPDGREVLLSSGSKGAHGFRSPKMKAKDEGWFDLDAEDEGNPSMVSEYVVDAFNYMLSIEDQTMPKHDYMDAQAELQWKMRAILMDWLIEVHAKFRLLPETLFIATNLVDRFLSKRVISLVKFQLVGLTALFIAAKYEEVICPSIDHFLHMTDGGYGTEEILKAERYMLSTLEFDLSYPNPLHFLRRISKADGYEIRTRTVAKYLVEISCVDHRLLKYKPSMLSAAAMWLAKLCLDTGEWTPNHVHYSAYSQDELLECAQVMLDHILDPEFNDTSSFYKKYASKKHMKASVYVQSWARALWPETASGANEQPGMELALYLASEE